MKLQDSLYHIVADKTVENGHQFDVCLNANHVIYQSHFPGEPITPGVCIMQIAVELLANLLQVSVQLVCAKNIKFMHIISPNEVPEVTYLFQKITQEAGRFQVQVTVTAPSAPLAPSVPEFVESLCKASAESNFFVK